MATVTLVANTNYSSLSLANDDTIDCAGFILTLDIQPTETGIQVTSPGTAGTVVFDDAWVIPSWDFFAGTAIMIATLPTGAEISSATGGTNSNARGCTTNNGTIGSATGGSSTGTHGVLFNNGTVDHAVGGTGSSRGVDTNNGTVNAATGGSASNANGVGTNNGTVNTATGGGVGNTNGVAANNGTVGSATGGGVTNTHGVVTNNGTVGSATGGSASTARGINTNHGLCIRITDSTGPAVGTWNGGTCFVEGPYVNGEIPDNIKTIYSLGTLSGGATIAGDATVIEVELAGGGGTPGPSRPRQGNLIGRSF